jgi:predicted NBD/HSP70 family sugar kinase
MQTTLGVDIGGSSVKAAVWFQGHCVRTGQSPFYANPTADQLRASIHGAVGSVGELEVSSVGLCAPGLFDCDRRVITFAVNLPALAGLSLDQLVPQALGLDGERPTTISNDATAAAYDIFKLRRLTGRLLVLSLGTGVGASVLDAGVPLLVEGDSPGHIGQIDVSIAGFEALGPDGGAGGLEGYIGVPALKRLYGPDIAATLEKFTGDEPAIHALIRALRICHAIYRPHHVYLCGGVGIRLRRLLPIIRERTGYRLTTLSHPNWTLDCGTDNYHAARGAAQLAAEAKDHSSAVLVG